MYVGLCVGCVGGICALANVAPNELVKIQKLYEEGNHAGMTTEHLFFSSYVVASLALQQKMIAPNRAVTATYGVSGLKAAMLMAGYDAGTPRSPLSPAPDATKEILRNIFTDAKILQ